MTPSQPEYRTIQLTRGQVTKVDAKDFDELSQYKWQALWDRDTQSFYAVRSTPMVNGGHRQTIRMHRQILGLQPGDERTGDHAFHDTLDNRRFIDGQENLRIATATEQIRNQRKQRNSTTGYKGITYRPKKRKYEATIRVDGKNKFLGYRDTAKDAHEDLYVPAALMYHGKFACVD